LQAESQFRIKLARSASNVDSAVEKSTEPEEEDQFGIAFDRSGETSVEKSIEPDEKDEDTVSVSLQEACQEYSTDKSKPFTTTISRCTFDDKYDAITFETTATVFDNAICGVMICLFLLLINLFVSYLYSICIASFPRY
jgi:hypothetical protein